MKSLRIYFNLRMSLYQSGKSREKVRYTHGITTSPTPQKTRCIETVAGLVCRASLDVGDRMDASILIGEKLGLLT